MQAGSSGREVGEHSAPISTNPAAASVVQTSCGRRYAVGRTTMCGRRMRVPPQLVVTRIGRSPYAELTRDATSQVGAGHMRWLDHPEGWPLSSRRRSNL
jgi:hypothetical protein